MDYIEQKASIILREVKGHLIVAAFSVNVQFSLPKGHGLQCYSCSKEDANEFCVGTDHIQSCSRNQDRCLTQTIYSGIDLKIMKSYFMTDVF